MRRNEHSLYIPGYSKCIIKYLTAFWVHFKYSGPFWWQARMFCSCSKLSRCIRSGEISTSIRNVFYKLHSDCIINIILAFQKHSKHSDGKPLPRQATSSCQKCSECASNGPECISNVSRLLPEAISILKKTNQLKCTSNAVGTFRLRIWNSLPNVARIWENSSFRLGLLDSCWFRITVTGLLWLWVYDNVIIKAPSHKLFGFSRNQAEQAGVKNFEYPGIYNEFSFRRHSGSFRLFLKSD